jgi:N-acetylglucosamine kinase-like BadF-type ATPase
MIVVVESGATKTDWVAVEEGKVLDEARTVGINLATMSRDLVTMAVEDALHQLRLGGARERVKELHFYAAGLISNGEAIPPRAVCLNNIFQSLFPNAIFEYASDLMAAARSVCGHKSGIAAILGTGSNSCFFDGTAIVKNVPPGGYILGDEGGGARLGRLFLSDYLKGLVPEPIASEFAGAFEVDYMTVVNNVYRGEYPAKYFGGFAPWVLERYYTDDYVRRLVDMNFRDFIERCLLQYDTKNNCVGLVGGWGFACKEIIAKIAEPYGIRFSMAIKAPVEGLIKYHANQ